MSFYLTETGVVGHTSTIAAGGELDMCAAPALRDALTRAIASVKHVVVDLSDATFMDSTAIGTLLVAIQEMQESGGRLHVICANRNVLRTFEIAGLNRHVAAMTPELTL
jgi:anti-sigma B factor antagonist